MKRYNMIKNIMLASATATLYWGWVVDGANIVAKVYGTLATFVLMLILLRDLDKSYMRKDKKHEQRKTA